MFRNIFHHNIILIVIFAYHGLFSGSALSESSQSSENSYRPRIITLSPHLTELVYAIDQGQHIVAVSDYSDYPEAATQHRTVASFEGANIAEIIRLKPTHILAWRGGNKDADIEKLRLLGFNLFSSSINSPQQLLEEITGIGEFLSVPNAAEQLRTTLEKRIYDLQNKYSMRTISAVYYLNQHPITGLGKDKWLNELLNLCGIQNIYANNLAAYPQLQVADILRQQPALLIAANGADISQAEAYWRVHKGFLDARIISANPDALHRFTSRAVDEMIKVCASAYH